MEFDAVATDWDGTLVDPDGRMTARTLEAVARFQAAGGLLIPASGRPVVGIHSAARRLGLDVSKAVLIGANGAEVEWGHGERVASFPVPDELVRAVWVRGLELGMVPVVFGDDNIFTPDPTSPPVVEEIVENGHQDVRCVDELPSGLDMSSPKVLLTRYPSVGVDLVEALRASFPGVVEATLSDPAFLEVTSVGVSKGSGLQRVVGLLGLDMRRVVAVGDSYNDISMIKCAGLGVAMDNAVDDVKAVAHHVTRSNREDGVAHLLEAIVSGSLLESRRG